MVREEIETPAKELSQDDNPGLFCGLIHKKKTNECHAEYYKHDLNSEYLEIKSFKHFLFSRKRSVWQEFKKGNTTKSQKLCQQSSQHGAINDFEIPSIKRRFRRR